MRAAGLRRLPLAVLVGIGAFGLHELRYLVVYRSEASEVLALREHAYLPLVTPVIAALLVLWLRRIVLARGGRESLPRLWAQVSTLILAIYSAQELAEGALAPDHPSCFAAVAGHGGWTALVLAVIIGLLVALALPGIEAAAAGPSAGAPRVRLARLAHVVFPTRDERATRDAVAHFLGGRGPPCQSVVTPSQHTF
jgi:hypothetical protein